MDMQQPPQASPMFITSGTFTFSQLPPSATVLFITADGKMMRGDRELKELSHDELLTVIGELVDLIRRR